MASTTNVISIGTLNVEAGSGYKAMLLYSFGQPAADITRVQRDANSSVVTNITPGTSEYLLQINIETADADTMAYEMAGEGETVSIAINRSDAAKSIGGLPAMALKDELSGEMVTGPSVMVPARSARILVAP